MRTYLAELLGTFALVFCGTGAIIINQEASGVITHLGIAITFVTSSWGTFDRESLFGATVYFDSLTMFVFFLLSGRALELRLRDRTAGALEALINRMPQSVERCLPDEQTERIAARWLAVGDRMRVGAGEVFAADGVIESGSTEVDEALLSGESRPLLRSVGDSVLAGSNNLSGTVVCRVTQVGGGTRYAEIAALMVAASTTKPDIAALADLQRRLLDRAVELVAPGGVIVYCTCSLETDEGEQQIADFLAREPRVRRKPIQSGEVAGLDSLLTPEGDLRSLPCHWPDEEARMGGLDGFYAARLERI